MVHDDLSWTRTGACRIVVDPARLPWRWLCVAFNGFVVDPVGVFEVVGTFDGFVVAFNGFAWLLMALSWTRKWLCRGF